MISTAYARMEDRARAAEAAGRGLLRHPEDPQLLSLRAKMLAMSDDRAAAARLCRQWRARDPEAAAPLAILSSIEREALRYPEAVRLAEQAVAVDPANAEHHRELGRALAALATPDSLRRAAAALQEAAERAPDDAKAPLLLAEVLQKLGDAEGARRQYARALDLDPSSRQAAVGLLQLSSQVGQSGRVAFYSEIVRALQERGDAAAVLWRRVYESDHDADAHARLAQLFLDAGDISQARYPLRRAVALRPGDKARAQQLRMIERLIELRQP
jgi:Flp pilus assembly protein TadD